MDARAKGNRFSPTTNSLAPRKELYWGSCREGALGASKRSQAEMTAASAREVTSTAIQGRLKCVFLSRVNIRGEEWQIIRIAGRHGNAEN